MSTPAVQISLLVPVVPKATTEPLILVDSPFLVALSKAEQRVGALQIKDVATLHTAAGLLNDLASAAKQFEEARVALKAPYLDLGRKIDEIAKPQTVRIDNLLRKVRDAMKVYNTAQAELAAKQERDRLEQIRQLEAEQARLASIAKKKADEEAAERAPTDLEFDDGPAPEAPKTVLEQKIEALKYAPAPVVPKVQGITYRFRLVHAVLDVAKLPDAFVVKTANDKLIRETYCVGFKEGMPVPELPGVRFTVDKSPITNGKTAEDF